MIISEFNILAKFQSFNHSYFNDELPLPSFKIRHSYRILGQFICSIDEYGNIKNVTIEISDSYDYTIEQFRDILMHEMIHYLLFFNGKDIKCTHGKEFKKMADNFNLKYNMNITAKIDLTEYSIPQGKSNFFFKLCTLF
jgi:hypothetical protein